MLDRELPRLDGILSRSRKQKDGKRKITAGHGCLADARRAADGIHSMAGPAGSQMHTRIEEHVTPAGKCLG
jgi:hypothetical protein